MLSRWVSYTASLCQNVRPSPFYPTWSQALKHPSCGESTIKVAGYLLGEFGHLIDDKPSSSCASASSFLRPLPPRCHRV